MDAATALGVGLAFVAILGSLILEGSSPMAILLLPAMLLVIGGTIGATMASGLLRDIKDAPGWLVKAFVAKSDPDDDVIPVLVQLADKARREGLLALEEGAREVDDPFLRTSLELAIDGTDPDVLQDILDAEVAAKRKADNAAAKVFADMGGYSPTMGIIGTVVGLVHVLQNLSSPERLGPLIASAFVATLWGIMLANVVWLPVSNRIKRLSELEIRRMEAVVGGHPVDPVGRQPAADPAEAAVAAARVAPPEADGRGGGVSSSRRNRRRRNEPEADGSHDNSERWLLTYSDMITLLMVLFVVLFALSKVDQAKWEALTKSLAAGFGAPQHAVSGGQGVLAGTQPDPDTLDLGVAMQAVQQQREAAAAQRSTLESARDQMLDALRKRHLDQDVRFDLEARGLVVSIVTDDVLFATGSATLRSTGGRVLDSIVGVLRTLPNDIAVEGHTDNVPIQSPQFATNWELSAIRATTVLRFLADGHGIASARLSSAGYADQRPVAPNSTAQGRARNRRVAVVVLADLSGHHY